MSYIMAPGDVMYNVYGLPWKKINKIKTGVPTDR